MPQYKAMGEQKKVTAQGRAERMWNSARKKKEKRRAMLGLIALLILLLVTLAYILSYTVEPPEAQPIRIERTGNKFL